MSVIKIQVKIVGKTKDSLAENLVVMVVVIALVIIIMV